MKGHISKYNDRSGSGFIETDTGDMVFFRRKDFVHGESVIGVEFTVEKDLKGLRARNIKRSVKCKFKKAHEIRKDD